MSDPGTTWRTQESARAFFTDLVTAAALFFGNVVYAAIALVPLPFVYLGVGSAAEGVRAFVATADVTSGLPSALEPGDVSAIAFVLIGIPVCGVVLSWLDQVLMETSERLFADPEPSELPEPAILSIPVLVALFAVWSLLASVGWAVWTACLIMIVHFAVARQVAACCASIRPLGLTGAGRTLFLGAAGLPVSTLTVVLFLTAVENLPEAATHVATGRIVADGPVIAFGPVTVGAWLVGLLSGSLLIALAYLLVQRSVTVILVRTVGRRGSENRPPALWPLVRAYLPVGQPPGPTSVSIDDDLTAETGSTGDSHGSDDGSISGSKYVDVDAEQAHREAQRREPPVEKGDVVELVLEEVEYNPNSTRVRGRIQGFHVFVDQDVPGDLEKHDVVRAKILYFNRDKTSATAAFLGRV